jgi:F-type H+-transporting ATPase subunit b
MIIDATFWVAISFVIFILILIYFKIPQKVKNILDENINQIKKQIEQAENLKEEAKNSLANQEKKLSNAKKEIQLMINKANEESERKILKAKENFHRMIELRKRNTEDKIKQMKNQAIKDIKNISINIAIESVHKLMMNSLDKVKLDKIYKQSIEETKLALRKKSS